MCKRILTVFSRECWNLPRILKWIEKAKLIFHLQWKYIRLNHAQYIKNKCARVLTGRINKINFHHTVFTTNMDLFQIKIGPKYIQDTMFSSRLENNILGESLIWGSNYILNGGTFIFNEIQVLRTCQSDWCSCTGRRCFISPLAPFSWFFKKTDQFPASAYSMAWNLLYNLFFGTKLGLVQA